jgi:hypothetical protein
MNLRLFLVPMWLTLGLLLSCSEKKELDACTLVSLTDAQPIINKPLQFNPAFTDKVRSLSSMPGVCVYSAGLDESAPRVVVSFRRYESQDLIKLSFNDAKETVWQKQKQEILGGIGDDAVMLDSSLIAFRKGLVWFQVGVVDPGGAAISVEQLKSAARKAAASI